MFFVKYIIAVIFVASCYPAASITMEGAAATRTVDIGEGYILIQQAVNHSMATVFCSEVGKTLVSIETVEEDKLILSLLRKSGAGSGDRIWTSGSNSLRSIHWRWGSGEPLYHTRWETLEPVHISNTLGLVLENDYYDRAWVTAPSNFVYHPLCENRATQIQTN